MCEICKKILRDFITESQIESEPYIREAMEKLRDKPCRELYQEYLTAISFFYHEAAKRLLLERGHREEEFDLRR